MYIKFYERARGDSPVLKFIQQLPEKHQKKISDKIDRFKRYGLQHSLHVRIIRIIMGKKYKGLYELIIDYDKLFYRIFFIMQDNACWFLHAIKKKSNKTPLKELNKALYIKKQIS